MSQHPEHRVDQQRATEGESVMVGRRVTALDDDRPCPLVGRVIGYEDEDRVLVLWGDAAYGSDMSKARIEYVDDLAPLRVRA